MDLKRFQRQVKRLIACSIFLSILLIMRTSFISGPNSLQIDRFIAMEGGAEKWYMSQKREKIQNMWIIEPTKSALIKKDISKKEHVESQETGPRLKNIPSLSLHNRKKSKPPKNIDLTQVTIPTGPPVDFANKCPGMVNDITTAAVGSMPLIALASFPRSGNTWSRMLLQVSTKISTGSVYWSYEKDNEWTKKIFPASTVDYHLRTGLCVKTHNHKDKEIEEFSEGVILLIRNPYKSLLSEFFREKMFDKRFSFNKTVALLKEFWWDYFPRQSFEWRNFNLAWIRKSKRLLIVFYEDLISNTMHELTRMLIFLGQTPNLHRMQCALMHYAAQEKETSYIPFDPNTPEQHHVLNQYIQEVNQSLVDRDAKPLPNNYVT